MRILALDIGDARIGFAVSDVAERIASPVCVLPTQEVMQHAKSFKSLLMDWEPEMLLVGLPMSLSGEQGKQASKIQAMAEQIATQTQLPITFADERLSSKEAKRILREEGLNEKQMRGKVDMIAASLFLQTWLDTRTNSTEE